MCHIILLLPDQLVAVDIWITCVNLGALILIVFTLALGGPTVKGASLVRKHVVLQWCELVCVKKVSRYLNVFVTWVCVQHRFLNAISCNMFSFCKDYVAEEAKVAPLVER